MQIGPAEWEVVRVAIGAAVAPVVALLLARLEPMPGLRHPRRWATAAALVTFVTYATLAVLKLRAYNMGSEDLGRIDQAIWNVLNGKLLVFSAAEIGREMSRLAGHVELLYVPLAPLFYLWDSAAVLLVAQAALVAVGAYPAFRIGARVGGDGLGLAAAVTYLAHPAVGFAALADIHGDTLAMPFLLFALDHGFAGRRRKSLVALALAVAAKEYVALLAIGLGLYWLIVRRDRRLAAGCIAIGFLWLLVVVPAFHHAYRPSDFPDLTPVYYGKLGATPGEVVTTALSRPWLLVTEFVTARKLGVAMMLLAALAYAPLAAPGLLLVGLPVFVPLALTEHFDLRNHHNASLIPLLVVAAIHGAHRVARDHAGLVLIAAAAVTHMAIAPSPLSVRSLTPGRWDFLANPHMFGRTDHDRRLDAILATIPRSARVSASGHLVPHLSHRPVCFQFPAVGDGVGIDVAIVDLIDGYPPAYRPRQAEIDGMRRLLNDHGFRIARAEDGIFVLVPGSAAAPGATASDPIDQPTAPRYPDGMTISVGPLQATAVAGGLVWTTTRAPRGPLLVLDADSGAVRLAPSTPLAPDRWVGGEQVADWEPLRPGTRLRVLELLPGTPAMVPGWPPQPWLPDPEAGSRLLP